MEIGSVQWTGNSEKKSKNESIFNQQNTNSVGRIHKKNDYKTIEVNQQNQQKESTKSCCNGGRHFVFLVFNILNEIGVNSLNK